MAGSLNKVILIGNLGQDPEMKHFEGDVSLARFSVATNESFKRKDGEVVQNTEWHNVVMWRGLAKVAEKYLKKGDKVYIEGRIKTRSYEDENKEMRKIVEIEALNMIMLGGNPPSGSGQGAQSTPDNLPKKESAQQPAGGNDPEPTEEDDLPF